MELFLNTPTKALKRGALTIFALPARLPLPSPLCATKGTSEVEMEIGSL